MSEKIVQLNEVIKRQIKELVHGGVEKNLNEIHSTEAQSDFKSIAKQVRSVTCVPPFFNQIISIIPLLFHSGNRQNKISSNKKIPAQFITDAGIRIELHIDILFSEMIFWTRCLFKLALEGGGCVSFLLDVLSGILANIISGKILMISKKHSFIPISVIEVDNQTIIENVDGVDKAVLLSTYS